MAKDKEHASWVLKSREYRDPEKLNKAESVWYSDLEKIQAELERTGYEETALQIELAKRSLLSHGTRRISPTHKGTSGQTH